MARLKVTVQFELKLNAKRVRRTKNGEEMSREVHTIYFFLHQKNEQVNIFFPVTMFRSRIIFNATPTNGEEMSH